MIPKITAKGYALLLNALGGVGIQFSKVVVGNGEKPADYRVLADLQNPILSADITEFTRMEKYAVLRAPMLNSDVEGRLHWTEIGVFAKDPEGGNDILYGYAHTDLSGDGQGISVPAHDTNMIELAHIIYVYVGEVDDVTAIIAQSSEYASAAALSAHTTNTSNPHKVTAQQIGLGNVPNVTPENQQPVFSNNVTSVTTDETGTKSLPNIQSGDLLGTILQKIRSAISAFMSHLNAKNPHGLRASDVGAAASTHYHSAADINKGTLSLLRGGTGGTTAEEARTNIGAAPTSHTHNYAGSSSAGGAANSAVKLSSARKVTVDLASKSGADFDGSKAITPGVTGILPITHGGTGASNVEAAREKLGVITNDEIANLYVWKKYNGDPDTVGETDVTNAHICYRTTSYGSFSSIQYADSYTFEGGAITLVNPISITNPTTSSLDSTKGKYVRPSSLAGSFQYILRIPSNATFSQKSASLGQNLVVDSATRISPMELLSYVASKSKDTYPNDGEDTDGYWYVYHKQLGE